MFHRTYLIVGTLALALFTWAQANDWSLFGSDVANPGGRPGITGGRSIYHK